MALQFVDLAKSRQEIIQYHEFAVRFHALLFNMTLNVTDVKDADMKTKPDAFDAVRGLWMEQTCRTRDVKGNSICKEKARLYAHFCDAHAKEFYGLSVQPSKWIIDHAKHEKASLGLFAEQSFQQGDLLDLYIGDYLNYHEYKKRYPSDQSDKCIYGMYDRPEKNVTYVIDSRSSQSCVSRYANDPSLFSAEPEKYKEYCNAHFQHIEDKKTDKQCVGLFAQRDIVPGEEILVCYSIS